MINRLLDRIDTPRRHLAVLMALLSITFVLTGVLALQAHRSERENESVAVRTQTNVAGTAATQVSIKFSEFAYKSVPGSTNPALEELGADPDVPLSTLVAHSDFGALCQICPDTFTPHAYFSIDVKSGDIAWAGDPKDRDIARIVLERARGGQYVRPGEMMGVGFYALPVSATPLALAYVRIVDDVPVRIFGVPIDSATVSVMLQHSLKYVTLHPEALARGISNDQLVAVRVFTGSSVPAISTGTPGVTPTATDTSMHPFFGARFEANVRDAAAMVLFPRARAAEWPVLAALTTLIALLFGASLLLVRREAEVARMRADFVASASHELRTPLAQIRMFTETLLLGRVRSDTERRRSLEIVDQEARRLSNLVENLLAFSRNEGGRMVRLAPEPTHVADEIRRAMESFGPMVRTSSVDIRAELQENVSVAVDRNALRQILVNLIDNALKYGPAGQRVTVGLALFDDAARVWVDDEGPGIPTMDRDKVFESFYRMRRDIDAKITGSGIGLAVVRQLARLHAGEAWAEAAPGGGARIVVQFPGAYLREAAAGNNLAAAS
jgi:signal transduction histidine kinase